MFLKNNLGYLSQIALKNIQLLIQIFVYDGKCLRANDPVFAPNYFMT